MHLKLVRNIKYILAISVALLLLPTEGKCNSYAYLDTIRTRIQNLNQTVADTVKVAQDTLVAAADTTTADTLVNNSSIQEPIFSGGKDSIVKDFNVDGRKMIYYYGDVKVTYGDLELSSEYMAFDVDSKTVFAKGLPDTSGTIFGQPKMKQGEKTYEMESVYYNFNTEKAKIKNMITQEAEGYLHGKYIKKMPDNSINIAKGKYTTCEHEHPHFTCR